MNRVPLYLLVYALAAVFFGWETYRAWTEPELPGKVVPAVEWFSRPVFVLPPKADLGSALYAGLSAVVARPVFRPDRRPPLQGGAGAVPQRNYEAELSRYTVVGVLFVGDAKMAVVVAKGPGKGERWEVGAGDSLPGFAVKGVGPDGLALVADDREFVLPLYAGGPKAVAGASLRTEVAPAPSPVPAQPPQAARPAPGAGRVTSPPVAAQSPPQMELRQVAPAPVPPRTYPRRYVPGSR